MATFHHSFEAIGTQWTVDVYHEMTQAESAELLQQILSRIDTYDRVYSRFRSDSVVSQMAHEAGEYQLPPDSEALFALYEQLYQLTEGAFTPLIGAVLVAAGYDASYSLRPTKLQQPLRWEDALSFSNQRVTLKKPAILDFGAAGKGHLVDIISALLKKQGMTEFCVDASGDIFYVTESTDQLRVGLENPDNFEQVVGVASISNQSICGSAGNRRKWGEFHHVIDPVSLTSPTGISAVWVVADSALLADALATCLFFVEPATLLPTFEFEYAIVNAAQKLAVSPGFPGTFFEQEAAI